MIYRLKVYGNIFVSLYVLAVSPLIRAEKCETACIYKRYDTGTYDEIRSECRCTDTYDYVECVLNKHDFSLVKAPVPRKDQYTRWHSLWD